MSGTSLLPDLASARPLNNECMSLRSQSLDISIADMPCLFVVSTPRAGFDQNAGCADLISLLLGTSRSVPMHSPEEWGGTKFRTLRFDISAMFYEQVHC